MSGIDWYQNERCLKVAQGHVDHCVTFAIEYLGTVRDIRLAIGDSTTVPIGIPLEPSLYL